MWVRGTGGETVAQGSSIGDSGATRTVYFIVVVLVLMAAGLLWFSFQYWRRTRPGSEALLERAARPVRSARGPRSDGEGRAERVGGGASVERRRPPQRDRAPEPRRGSGQRPSLFDDDAPDSVPERRPRSSDPRIDPRVEPRRSPRPEPRREARPERAPAPRSRVDRRLSRDDGADLAGLLEDDPNAYRRGPAIRRSSDPPRDPLL